MRSQPGSSFFRYSVSPMWSFGAIATSDPTTKSKSFHIEVNIGAWLVLARKLSDPTESGTRFLPDGRTAAFKINESGLAEISSIDDGGDHIYEFVSSLFELVHSKRVHCDVEICILFLLLHEYAHCASGHASPNEAPPLREHSRAVEHHADLIATNLLLMALRNKAIQRMLQINDRRDCNVLIATGRSVAITLAALCEQEVFRRSHPTHPSVGDRVAMIIGRLAFVSDGYTKYERDGLVAGLTLGLNSLPSWYSRMDYVDRPDSYLDDLVRVFEYYDSRTTEIKDALRAQKRPASAKERVLAVSQWTRDFIWQNFKMLLP